MPIRPERTLRWEQFKKVLRHFIWILPVLFTVVWFIGRIYALEVSQHNELLASLEQQFCASRLEIVHQNINMVAQDLLFLAQTCENSAEHGDELSETQMRALESLFLTFAKSKDIYNQICLLDTSSRKKIFIQHNNGSPIVARPTADSQDTFNLDYFQSTMELRKGQIYVFPPDTEGEPHHVLVEPILRLATPVFAHEGNRIGVLIFHYSTEDLLTLLRASSSMSTIMLLNHHGDWLQKTNPFIEEAIKQHKNFSEIFPQEASFIYSQECGQLKTPRGLFTFTTIRPFDLNKTLNASSDYFWKIVSMVPLFSLQEQDLHIKTRFQTVTIIIIIFILLISSILFIVEYERRKKILADLQKKSKELEEVNIALNSAVQKTAHDAMIDPLTELWNRRYMVKRLREEEFRIQHTAGSACIAVIDLGNFKKVNDTYGHDRGDRTLAEIAALLRKGLRQTDYVARSGGDEFLIYFADLPLKKAGKIMDRLYTKIVQRSAASAGFPVFPDYGVAHCPSDAPTLEETVKVADARMYEFKARRKKEMADSER